MIKKLAALVGAGALILGVVTPVLGFGSCYGPYCYNKSSYDVVVENDNDLFIHADADAYANTGKNDMNTNASFMSMASGGGVMTTGNAAVGAGVNVETGNVTRVGCCWLKRDVKVDNDNDLFLFADADAYANTGKNDMNTSAGMMAGACGGGRMTTGWADVLGAVTVVSYNMTSI
jgi:hypothetical protein